MILLDTHVLAWIAEGNPQTGLSARRLADDALQKDELMVSAFSFWELAMLEAKGRLKGDWSADRLRRKSLEQGIREVVVSGEIGIAAVGLAGLPGDPADRIIAATAMSVDATLLTADERLLRWRGKLRTVDARR